MDTLWNDLKHWKALAAVALVLTAWPSFVQKTRVISFQKFMTIQTSKVEPPRLAFDEVHLKEKKSWNEWDFLQSKSGIQLKTEDEWNQFATRSPVQSLRNRKVVLAPMVFTRGDIEKTQRDADWLNEMAPAEQKRLEMAQEKHGTLDQDWELPSFKKLAAEKIDEVKKELGSERQIASSVIVQSRRDDGTIADRSSIQTADVQIRKENGLYQVSGMIEVKGLPSGSSQWQIQIARYENDVPKESARVNTKNSTYDISVAALSGSLKAQMVDTHSGVVLGEGSMRLSQFGQGASAQKAKLTIEKVTHDVAGRLGDFYRNPESLIAKSAGRQKAISAQVLLASLNSESKTDEKGSYHFDQIQKGSWGILRTEAKGYQSAMFLVQSGNEKQLPLFPQAMIQALKQIIKDQSLSSEVAETGSIVWGQVIQNGKPVAGAEVDVEFMENYQPIYFNNLLLPDPNLKATGENGYFAVLHLPAGFHSIVASFGQNYLSHANVVVDDDTVSTAILESTLQTEKAEVKLFDAFSGKPESALLELQGLPNAVQVDGFANVFLSPISRLSLMIAKPANPAYVDSLQMYDDADDSLPVPLIRKDWLADTMAIAKISSEPEKGMILGFVESGDYQVYLSHLENFSKDQIVYFNAQGQISPTSVAGGGFVIFNVPTGVHSIVVAKTKSEMIQTQVGPVDNSKLVTLKFR